MTPTKDSQVDWHIFKAGILLLERDGLPRDRLNHLAQLGLVLGQLRDVRLKPGNFFGPLVVIQQDGDCHFVQGAKSKFSFLKNVAPFDCYEKNPGEFGDGFVETYAQQIEPVTNGDTNEDQAHREKFAVMAEALAWVFQYCWLGPRGVTRDARVAFRRFVAVSMTVRPDLFNGMSFQAMARKLRLSKAALSKLSLDFSDKVGLHFRRNRRESARKKFSAVQKRIWTKRRSVNGARRRLHRP